MTIGYIEDDEDLVNPVSEGVVMFNEACTAIVMVQHGDSFDLPRFHFDVMETLGKKIHLLIDDLHNWLGVEIADGWVSALTRLFSVYDPVEERRLEVVVLECHPNGKFDDLSLPTGATWMTEEKISQLDASEGKPGGIDAIKRNVLKCLHSRVDNEMSYFTTMTDVRYRFGWYEEASKYFASLMERENVEMEGRIVQHQVTHTSTILKVKSNEGWYFLKAPALGVKEVQITGAVTSMFPESSPVLLDVNRKLNCFVSKGFQHVPPGMKAEDIRRIVRKVGYFHSESVNRTLELAAAGCPVRDMAHLVEELESWYDHPVFGPYLPGSSFPEVLLKVKRMTELLQDYNLPTTLVHGDVGLRNMSTNNPNGEDLLFFDWAFAYIGVPFLDFCELSEDMTAEMLEEYLNLWTSYESMDRLKEAFKIACFIGYFMRCWSLVDLFKACDHDITSLGSWCLATIEWADYRMVVHEDKGLFHLS